MSYVGTQHDGAAIYGWRLGDVVAPDDVPLAARPAGDGPWAYDAGTQLAAPSTPLATARQQALAADLVDNDRSPELKIDRAVVILAVKQLNVCRQWMMALQAGTAGAGTLAAFKTMAAGLPALPDIAVDQTLMTALKNQIKSGEGD